MRSRASDMIATPSAPQIFVAGNHRADLFLIRCDATDTIKTLSQTPYNDGTIVRDKAIHPYTLALYLFTLNNIQIINSVFFISERSRWCQNWRLSYRGWCTQIYNFNGIKYYSLDVSNCLLKRLFPIYIPTLPWYLCHVNLNSDNNNSNLLKN